MPLMFSSNTNPELVEELAQKGACVQLSSANESGVQNKTVCVKPKEPMSLGELVKIFEKTSSVKK
jgi:hypothetical protein